MEEVKILLVEDNVADADLIRYTFKKNKLANKLTVIEDGESAINYLFRKGEYELAEIPDMIILDINIPKLNGLEVLKIAKEDPIIRVIPIIMLTTSESDLDIIEAYKNYANAYLVKPVEIDEFIKVVTNMEEFMIKVIKRPKVYGDISS